MSSAIAEAFFLQFNVVIRSENLPCTTRCPQQLLKTLVVKAAPMTHDFLEEEIKRGGVINVFSNFAYGSRATVPPR